MCERITESVSIDTYFLAASCFPYVRIEAKVAPGYHTKQQAQAAEALRKNSRILKSLPSKRPALMRVCTDIDGILSEYLPPVYTNSIEQFTEVWMSDCITECCRTLAHARLVAAPRARDILRSAWNQGLRVSTRRWHGTRDLLGMFEHAA